jgi:hypothetical protein
MEKPTDIYYDVGRLKFGLIVSGQHQSPAEISLALGIQPDYAHCKGDQIINAATGRIGRKRRSNIWVYDSESLTDSKNLDDHARVILERVLPLTLAITKLAARNEIYFSAKWESSRLDWGSGPTLSAETCRDIALIGIELSFDIYCSLPHDV